MSRTHQIFASLTWLLLVALVGFVGCRQEEQKVEEKPALQKPMTTQEKINERMVDPAYKAELSEKGAALRAARRASVDARRRLKQIEDSIRKNLPQEASLSEVTAACQKNSEWVKQKAECERLKAESLRCQREVVAVVSHRMKKQEVTPPAQQVRQVPPLKSGTRSTNTTNFARQMQKAREEARRNASANPSAQEK